MREEYGTTDSELDLKEIDREAVKALGGAKGYYKLAAREGIAKEIRSAKARDQGCKTFWFKRFPPTGHLARIF